MTRRTLAQTQPQVPTSSFLSRGNILQRKCESCGNHRIAGGECGDCAQKKSGLQRKLAIGASNDPLEQEADRVADQVMAASASSAVSSAPPRIQRFTGQMTEGLSTAPASVDRVLSSPGRPLEPALQQDMGQRFNYDFSRVRVHTDTAAARSAQDVNAHAYTLGNNIVFGAGQFAPGTQEGRFLMAHELTHVVQQSDEGEKEKVVTPATRPIPAITRSGARSGLLMPYRSRPKDENKPKPKEFNFGKKNEPGLQEDEFTNEQTQPWIERITIHFTGTQADSSGVLFPTGTLKAEYFKNQVAKLAIKTNIGGGSIQLGLTDQGTDFTVQRIEGIGYNDVPQATGGEGPHNKYSKNLNGSMSYAVFFKYDKQAIHAGDLNEGSHSCVHVDWNNLHTIRQINYHSEVRKTKVDVSYDPAPLKKLCCARLQFKGAKKKGEVPNPCNNQDPKNCP